MMDEVDKNVVFKGNMYLNSFFSPCSRQQQREPVEKCVQSLYSSTNVYLWMHGIGFTKKISCRRENRLTTVASILMLAVLELNFAYVLYSHFKIFYTEGFNSNNGDLATLLISIINFRLRLLLYFRRNELGDIIVKLSSTYATVSAEIKALKIFKAKLIVFLIANDIFYISYVAYLLYKIRSDYTDDFSYGDVESPYAVPVYCMSYLILYFGYVILGVTGYVCAVFFVLKQLLAAFKANLSESDLSTSITTHREVANMISNINIALQPYLTATFAAILLSCFRDGYRFLFVGDERDVFSYLNLVLTFSKFMLICRYSSGVADAGEEFKTAAHNSVSDFSNPKCLQFTLQVNEGFARFKIMSSVAVDMSLVPIAGGILLAYGILVATFNSFQT